VHPPHVVGVDLEHPPVAPGERQRGATRGVALASACKYATSSRMSASARAPSIGPP
jgi:hypothetical protein